jgi:hypothetical protein
MQTWLAQMLRHGILMLHCTLNFTSPSFAGWCSVAGALRFDSHLRIIRAG